MQSPEVEPTASRNLVLIKVASHTVGADEVFSALCWDCWLAPWKKRKLIVFLILYTRINSKWDLRPKYKK